MGPVLSDAGPSPNILASGPVNKTVRDERFGRR